MMANSAGQLANPNPRPFLMGGIFIAQAMLIFFGVALIMDIPSLAHIGEEDNLIENLGALSFLFSSILFGWLFWSNRRESAYLLGKKCRGAWAFLALCLLFFFIAGEEISWGQRLIGWATPAWMAENNIQGETTIHNLEFFNVYGRDEIKPFWQRLYSMNRMFSMFWLAWCLMIPLGAKFSPRFAGLVEKMGIPIPKLIMGFLFFSIYVSAKLFIWRYQPGDALKANIDELKEAFYAVFFLIVAIYFVLQRLRQLREVNSDKSSQATA
ncbi:MAG: hypothetical protein AAF585_05265 [Verrucomicrobiota bacterium]